MAVILNPFIKVINSMNGIPTQVSGFDGNQFLQQRFQAREASLYISMHQVMAQVAKLLAPGEKIINMLPMTNEENAGIATDGMMGMYAPKQQATKDYVTSQSSLRGNRLMIFTDRRMIFFVVIEFLDDPTAYYSYEYRELKHLMLKQHTTTIPGAKPWQRAYFSSYHVDFETPERHIFSETLTEDNFKLFKHNLLTIPAMGDIEITGKMDRSWRRDNWLSNWHFWAYLFGGLIVFALLATLIGGLIQGF